MLAEVLKKTEKAKQTKLKEKNFDNESNNIHSKNEAQK
jgi:hypothetical protein